MAFKPFKNYRLLRRYQHIIVTLGRYGFDELAGRLNLFALLKLKSKSAVSSDDKPQGSRALRFRLMLEQLGPTFIKFGQILSTRPDLVPPDILKELANLRDDVTPTPWQHFQKKLKSKDGKSFESQFAQFNTDPIASASMAQVYQAQLKTGQKVAVKIIRPGTEAIIADDLIILDHLAGVITTHIEEAQRWNPQAIVDQLRSSVEHELDLLHEARNAEIFRKNFQDDDTVYVPKIHWDYCSEQALVMEFVNGRSLADFLTPDADTDDKKTLAQRGARAVLKQVYEHGFFQADPHPGNIFVMPGNVICFLDFGMFGRLDATSLHILSRVLHAIVKKDVDRLLRAARDLHVLPDEFDRTALRVALLDILEQYHGQPLKQISMRRLLSDIMELVSKYNLGIRHEFLFLIKAMTTIEITGRQLDPDFDLLSMLQPFVRKLLLKRYSPKYIADESLRLGEDITELAQQAPEHILEIMRKLRSGHVKLEFHHKGLEQPLDELNRMVDKMTGGLIVGSLIIASALMAHSNIGPTVHGFPLIGGVGFFLAGIAGVWLLIDSLRSRKH